MSLFLIIFILAVLSISCEEDSLEICSSNLAGTYTYKTPANSSICDLLDAATDMLEHEELTGTIEITELEENLYTISDWSFGAYRVCHEALNPNQVLVADSESLTFRDSCGIIIFNNTDLDKYGDRWKFESSIEGKEWRIKWASSIESGTSVIINPNGWNLTVGQ